jgi:hypothetical protein
MTEFLLIIRGGEDGMSEAGKSPEQLQQGMMKWKTWMEGLVKRGKLIAGHPLAKEGSVISGGKKVVTDGPFVEGKEIVGGYLMIRADDFPDAVAIAKDCPIFEDDGIVEVREVKASPI